MDKQTAFRILGIKPTSDFDTISKTYRKKCLQYHPDKNHSTKAPEMFMKVKEAYETLLVSEVSDPFSVKNTYHKTIRTTIREIYLRIPHTIRYGDGKFVKIVVNHNETRRVIEVEGNGNGNYDCVLIIDIIVLNDGSFRFENGVLVKTERLSPAKALAGGKFMVEHITGRKIPISMPEGVCACPAEMISVPGEDLILEFVIDWQTSEIPPAVQEAIREHWL